MVFSGAFTTDTPAIRLTYARLGDGRGPWGMNLVTPSHRFDWKGLDLVSDRAIRDTMHRADGVAEHFSPADEINLIGHSLGGLMMIAFRLRHPELNFGRMTAISAPFEGTNIPYRNNELKAAALRLVEGLGATASPVDLHMIASEGDRVVPATSALATGPALVEAMEGVDAHRYLLTNHAEIDGPGVVPIRAGRLLTDHLLDGHDFMVMHPLVVAISHGNPIEEVAALPVEQIEYAGAA